MPGMSAMAGVLALGLLNRMPGMVRVGGLAVAAVCATAGAAVAIATAMRNIFISDLQKSQVRVRSLDEYAAGASLPQTGCQKNTDRRARPAPSHHAAEPRG